ncbi:hypothetical protein GW17_00061444 [Ensete ventricosum]|nr:hypothetical protein GW17_00061444 [Ensete ventricosum]RZS26755.1 hypothetical protein BHM03_00060140 [Ensete ventricosum]
MVAGGSPLRFGHYWLALTSTSRAAAPCGLAAGGIAAFRLGRSRSPLQGGLPWLATLVGGLAMADRPLSSLFLLRKHSKNA